jgi:hypothetical protein
LALFFYHNLCFKYPNGWVMQTHFRHISLKSFPMVWGTLQCNEFWPLLSPSEDSRIHRNFNSQNGSSLRNVGVHSLTFSYIIGSMKCDSQASLLVRSFISLCLNRKPKARVAPSAIIIVVLKIQFLVVQNLNQNIMTRIFHSISNIPTKPILFAHFLSSFLKLV